jgi:hypothetical protein
VQRNASIGCECDHLSDFIAVRRPSLAAETIDFASLVDNVTLHCACTNGIRVTLVKPPLGSQSTRVQVSIARPLGDVGLERIIANWTARNQSFAELVARP